MVQPIRGAAPLLCMTVRLGVTPTLRQTERSIGQKLARNVQKVRGMDRGHRARLHSQEKLG